MDTYTWHRRADWQWVAVRESDGAVCPGHIWDLMLWHWNQPGGYSVMRYW